MSVELIKYAFIAGEVSKTYTGRSDLEQYDFGLALAKNWFVDYRGGLSTRPGQPFIDYMKFPALVSKYVPFEFSPDISNTYNVLFEHNLIRFLQDGGYVLEAAKTVTAVAAANPGVFTSNAHGYAAGDWLRFTGITDPNYQFLNDRTFEVVNFLTNTFTIKTIPGTPVSTLGLPALVGPMSVARVYTLVSPYPSTALEVLRAFQIRDTIRLTHADYPIYNLKRIGHTNWTITPEVIGNTAPRPQLSAINFSSAGTSAIAAAVTAIMADGTESLAGDVALGLAGVNFTATAGYVRLAWTTVPGAVRYRVYRSTVVEQTLVNRGMQLGYIGSTQANEFVDNNIIPDFTRAPPEFYNPFAAGAIREVNVTAPGTGYTLSSVLNVTGGTGFVGNLVVAPGTGQVNNVGIVNGGSGYTTPGYSISIGSGATLTFVVSPLVGTYPSVSAVFQQRQIYAGSLDQPLTVWGSKPGLFSNFDASSIVVSSDSFEFDLDSAQLAPIKHLFVVRGGLMMMTQTGVWLLSGGGPDTVVTPTNALAQPQTYTGVSPVPPLKINTDLVYIEGKGTTVRLLSYNEYSRVYSGDDVSILSNHLMPPSKPIRRWTYAENPYKIVWSVRSDGIMLGFTLVKEQKVFAWTHHATKGFYRDCITVQEDGVDRTYFAVNRYVQGQLVKFIERQDTRTFATVEDSVCTDASLVLPARYPAFSLSYSVPTNDPLPEITLTASGAAFGPGDVNNVVRGAGGKFKIKTYVSPTQVIATVRRAPTNFLPEDDSGKPLDSLQGEWTHDVPTTVLGGLWHLEGEKVSILGDGNVFPQQVVENDTVTLNVGVTRAVVGLPYECLARSLPATTPQAVIEGRRKRTMGTAIRTADTRGLAIGPDLDRMFDMKDRTNELWGEPILLQDGVHYQLLDTKWDEENQTYFQQLNPLPATILSIVFDMEVGDDVE